MLIIQNIEPKNKGPRDWVDPHQGKITKTYSLTASYKSLTFSKREAFVNLGALVLRNLQYRS